MQVWYPVEGRRHIALDFEEGGRQRSPSITLTLPQNKPLKHYRLPQAGSLRKRDRAQTQGFNGSALKWCLQRGGQGLEKPKREDVRSLVWRGKGWGSYWNLQRIDGQKGVSERRRGLQETMVTHQEEKYPDIILLPSSAFQPPPQRPNQPTSQQVRGSVGPAHRSLPPSTQSRGGKWGGGNRWSNTQIKLGAGSEMTIHTKNAIWPTPHSHRH